MQVKKTPLEILVKKKLAFLNWDYAGVNSLRKKTPDVKKRKKRD